MATETHGCDALSVLRRPQDRSGRPPKGAGRAAAVAAVQRLSATILQPEPDGQTHGSGGDSSNADSAVPGLHPGRDRDVSPAQAPRGPRQEYVVTLDPGIRAALLGDPERCAAFPGTADAFVAFHPSEIELPVPVALREAPVRHAVRQTASLPEKPFPRRWITASLTGRGTARG